MLARYGNAIVAAAREFPPWSRTVGVARTMLAGASLVALVGTDPSQLFGPAAGIATGPHCAAATTASFFCVASAVAVPLDIAVWVAVGILALVMSGWRPRVTGPLHWWISWSIFASATIVEGGDQVAAAVTLLLLPVSVLDDRRWHWEDRPLGAGAALSRPSRVGVAMACIILVRLQVSVIYFQSSVAKFGVEEWADGTAAYYWLYENPVFGSSGVVRELLGFAFMSPIGVLIATWTPLIIEFFIAVAVFLGKRARNAAFVLGVLLHVGIAVAIGLVSFSVVMIAAMLLALRPRLERREAVHHPEALPPGEPTSRVRNAGALDGGSHLALTSTT